MGSAKRSRKRQRLSGIEHRRKIDRQFVAALIVGLGPLRDQHRGEHIVGAVDAVDDIRTDRLGTETPTALQHSLEHGDRALGHRIELDLRPLLTRQQINQTAGPGSAIERLPQRLVDRTRDDPMQHRGVLPDIETREMEAEHRDATQQALHGGMAGILATMREQTVCDGLDIALELLRTLVAGRPAVVGRPQTLRDLAEKHPVGHAIVPRRCPRPHLWQQSGVGLDALLQRRGHTNPARALRKQLAERLHLAEISVDDGLLLARKRLADRLGVDIRVAVHVATDPGPESDDGRDIDGGGGLAIVQHQGLANFLVERRYDVVENLHQIKEDMLTLVRDGEPLPRVVFGLP